MKPTVKLRVSMLVLIMLAGCASAPLGPFQYTPDEKKVKGYQRVGKALRITQNNLEITVEPLTMGGLTKVLNPGEKPKEIGMREESTEKLKNNFVFYVTIDNQSKKQVLFTSEKCKLIYNRKNWYKVDTSEEIRPIDYAQFYTVLNKIEGAQDRLETIRSNIFHGATFVSPGQKKSGLIFYPWGVNEAEVIDFQLSMPGVFMGKEMLDFAFNFKMEPIAAATAPPSPPKK